MPDPIGDIGILHLAGALNERAEDDGAVGNRDAHYVVGIKGMWAPGDPNEPHFRDWVRAADDRVRPYGTGRIYVNFQIDDEPDARVRASYGTNYARLASSNTATTRKPLPVQPQHHPGDAGSSRRLTELMQ